MFLYTIFDQKGFLHVKALTDKMLNPPVPRLLHTINATSESISMSRIVPQHGLPPVMFTLWHCVAAAASVFFMAFLLRARRR